MICLFSCGRPIAGCKTKLDNPDKDGIGEICFWGRNTFMGYLNSPEKTAEAIDQDGWLHSGDLGIHDQHGFLYITGRIKGKLWPNILLCMFLVWEKCKTRQEVF